MSSQRRTEGDQRGGQRRKAAGWGTKVEMLGLGRWGQKDPWNKSYYWELQGKVTLLILE